jgi:hypothetical protein
MTDLTDPALDGPVLLPVPSERKGILTEAEIKDCWRTNMLGAADDCSFLQTLPAQGATFVRLRERLKLAEGACRQMGHWREDSRWLYLAPQLENLHQMARVMIVSHYARQLFTKLEITLRKIVDAADALENKKTGKVGMILPDTSRGPHRDTKPVSILLP